MYLIALIYVCWYMYLHVCLCDPVCVYVCVPMYLSVLMCVCWYVDLHVCLCDRVCEYVCTHMGNSEVDVGIFLCVIFFPHLLNLEVTRAADLAS